MAYLSEIGQHAKAYIERAGFADERSARRALIEDAYATSGLALVLLSAAAAASLAECTGLLYVLVVWWLSGRVVRSGNFPMASTLMALAFSGSASIAVHALIGGDIKAVFAQGLEFGSNAGSIAISSVFAALAALVFWIQFRVPVAIATAMLLLYLSLLFAVPMTFATVTAGDLAVLTAIFMMGTMGLAWYADRRHAAADWCVTIGAWLHALSAMLSFWAYYLALTALHGNAVNAAGFAQCVLLCVCAAWINRRIYILAAMVTLMHIGLFTGDAGESLRDAQIRMLLVACGIGTLMAILARWPSVRQSFDAWKLLSKSN